jgi:hypothetical protein
MESGNRSNPGQLVHDPEAHEQQQPHTPAPVACLADALRKGLQINVIRTRKGQGDLLCNVYRKAV